MSGESLQRAMTCDELEGFVYVYLDGEFAPSEKVEFERHLAQCPACARKVRLESAFREKIRRLARENAIAPSARAPETVRRSIQSWLRQEQQRAALRSWVRAGAAAAVIAAAGGAYLYSRPGLRGVYVEAADRMIKLMVAAASKPGQGPEADPDGQRRSQAMIEIEDGEQQAEQGRDHRSRGKRNGLPHA